VLVDTSDIRYEAPLVHPVNVLSVTPVYDIASLSISITPDNGKPVASVIAIVVALVEVTAALSVVEEALKVITPAEVVLRTGVMSLKPPPFSM